MKTRILIALVAMLVGIIVCRGQSAPPPPSVTLAWDVVPNTNVVAYRVYWGTGTRAYTNLVAVTGRTNNSAVVANLDRGVTYFFAATSLDRLGLESEYSTEVSYTTAVLPPKPFNLTVTTKNP